MAFVQNIHHIVFSPKHRAPVLNPAYQRELYAYIYGLLTRHQCHCYRINGMPDHLHILAGLHPTMAVAELVKKIKVATNKWMGDHPDWFPRFECWAEGYFSGSLHPSRLPATIEYIKNQQEHHRQRDFVGEYKALLEEYGIAYDERYL